MLLLLAGASATSSETSTASATGKTIPTWLDDGESSMDMHLGLAPKKYRELCAGSSLFKPKSLVKDLKNSIYPQASEIYNLGSLKFVK